MFGNFSKRTLKSNPLPPLQVIRTCGHLIRYPTPNAKSFRMQRNAKQATAKSTRKVNPECMSMVTHVELLFPRVNYRSSGAMCTISAMNKCTLMYYNRNTVNINTRSKSSRREKNYLHCILIMDILETPEPSEYS